MYQFYALNILFNLVGGTTLAFDFLEEKVGIGKFLNRDGFDNEFFRTALGGLTFASGFAKLISVTAGNWYVLGDFLPALAAMVTGFTLLLQRFSPSDSLEVSDPATFRYKLDKVFVQPRNVYGTISIIAAVTHLLFHTAQFL